MWRITFLCLVVGLGVSSTADISSSWPSYDGQYKSSENASRTRNVPDISSTNFVIRLNQNRDKSAEELNDGGINFGSGHPLELDLSNSFGVGSGIGIGIGVRTTKTRAAAAEGESGERLVRLCQENNNNNDGGELKIPKFAILTKLHEEDSGVNFRFSKSDPYCGSEALELILSSDTIENNAREENSIGIMTNGYLKIRRDFYNTDEYCVNRIQSERIELKYCHPSCGNLRPCVPKCFPPNEIMSFFPRRAPNISGPLEFQPTFYYDFPQAADTAEGTIITFDLNQVRPHFVQHKPKRDFKCTDSALHIHPYSEEIAKDLSNLTKSDMYSLKFRVQTDGRVFYESLDHFNCPMLKELEPGTFCVDGLRNVGQVTEFRNLESEGIVFSCGLSSKNEPTVSFIFGIIMIVSCLFLVLTLIVYILLFHQQNIHGWTIMAHVTSMFFAYVFLGLTRIINAKFPEILNTSWCYATGVLAHFFFLSTFFWLLLISFSLYCTFRSVTPSKNTGGTRMIVHFIIGCGVPALIVFVSVVLDLIIGQDCTSLYLPKYGQKNCYLATESQGVYIFYPIAVTLILNTIFFCITLYKLHHYKSGASKAVKNKSSNRQLLELFTKLFFVMGITWIFEFISWLHVGTDVRWYWTILDFLNILQAVAIFVIYVCKQDVLESLEKKYPSLNTRIRRCIQGIRRSGPTVGGEPGSVQEEMQLKGSSSGFGEESSDKEKTRSSSLPHSVN